MWRFCITLIFSLTLSSTFSQSRITSPANNLDNDRPVTSYSQPEPTFQSGNEYPISIPESAYNQPKPVFQPGVIITKNGDTLSGLVRYNYSVPFNKVSYRRDSADSDSTFAVQKIKSIITQFVYLANIPFKGQEIMMPWLRVGKINLYSFSKYYNGITYVLEKNNQFTYIDEKDFKVMMGHVLFDAPDLVEKIGNRGYKFNNMIAIVKEYNERFQQTNK